MNRKTEYALMALRFIAARGFEKTTAREICDQFHTPFDTTAKVLQAMNHNGILTSVQGVNGGYVLDCDLEQINYHDFTHMIEGKQMSMDCVEGSCELSSSCNISGPVKKLNNYLVDFFKGLTLKKLLQEDELIHLTIPMNLNEEVRYES
ncbi:MAG: Rrf2 family transcriptional regulator [Bacteriovoracaceae bacterium]|nr:Rrf2 family transcriptional regulator [Bacteriovoracaceae bacterium]